MSDTVTLYRPVGPHELELIRNSGWKEFPERLPEQPIFYPVLTREYAAEIARDWNSVSPGTDFKGYVTKFNIRKDYIDKFEIRSAGNSKHLEYWIEAAELENFNKNITGFIEVTDAFEHKERITD